jgi:hypothetical protein
MRSQTSQECAGEASSSRPGRARQRRAARAPRLTLGRRCGYPHQADGARVPALPAVRRGASAGGMLIRLRPADGHQAITWLKTNGHLNKMFLRWLDKIEDFHFDAKHVQGLRTCFTSPLRIHSRVAASPTATALQRRRATLTPRASRSSSRGWAATPPCRRCSTPLAPGDASSGSMRSGSQQYPRAHAGSTRSRPSSSWSGAAAPPRRQCSPQSASGGLPPGARQARRLPTSRRGARVPSPPCRPGAGHSTPPWHGIFVALAGVGLSLGTGTTTAPSRPVPSIDLVLSPTFVQTLPLYPRWRRAARVGTTRVPRRPALGMKRPHHNGPGVPGAAPGLLDRPGRRRRQVHTLVPDVPAHQGRTWQPARGAPLPPAVAIAARRDDRGGLDRRAADDGSWFRNDPEPLARRPPARQGARCPHWHTGTGTLDGDGRGCPAAGGRGGGDRSRHVPSRA